MQFTMDVNIEQLIQNIKLIPANQIAKIMTEIAENDTQKTSLERAEFQMFLLQGL